MELIVFGGILFWIAVLVVAITLLVTVEHESFFGSAVAVVGFLTIMQLFSTWPVVSLIFANPASLALWVAGYLVLGALYGVIKWFSFVYKVRDAFTEKKAEWIATWQKGPSPNTKMVTAEGELTNDGADFIIGRVQFAFRLTSLPPKPSDRKQSLILWMMYWPISLIGTVIDDPVRRFFSMVYRKLSGTLQGISNRAFEGHLPDASQDVSPKA